jgi:hypothetical protein
VWSVRTEVQLHSAWEHLGGRKAVLKLEFGVASCGVHIVATREDALGRFRELRKGMDEGRHLMGTEFG